MASTQAQSHLEAPMINLILQVWRQVTLIDYMDFVKRNWWKAYRWGKRQQMHVSYLEVMEN